MQIPYPDPETTKPSAFEAAEFADNPEPRVACLLLLDTSGSMAGEKIQQLNEGLAQLDSDLIHKPTDAVWFVERGDSPRFPGDSSQP